MRQMCGFDDGKPAVDFIKVMDKRTGEEGKLWLCAEHWDEYTRAPGVFENKHGFAEEL
jgi:hypothetical protein